MNKITRIIITLFFLGGACLWAGGKKDVSDYEAVPPEDFDPAGYALPLPETNVSVPENPVVLTVEDAVLYALGNSSTLKNASIDLGIKQRAKDVNWNVFVPTVTLGGGFSRSTEVTDTAGAILSQIPGFSYQPKDPAEADHWSVAASVSVSLNFSLALIDGLKLARMNYEAGLITWEQVKKQTERDVQRMFYSILLMQENLKLMQENLETAQQRAVQAQANFRNGLVPELTVLQAQVTYENMKPSILELEQNVQQQIQMFGFLLGFPYGTDIVLSGQIDPVFVELDADELVGRYLGTRLDIVSLQRNIRLMETQLSASKLQTYTPALSLGYTYAPVLTSPINESWFGKASGGRDRWTDTGKFSITLAFNVTNVLPFSSAVQAIKDTEANIVKMKLNLVTLVQNSEMEIQTLVDKLNKSKTSIDASQLNIDLAQRAYDLTVVAFRNGTKELLDVRDAETQLNQAKLALMQEKFNYVSGLLDLEYALNTSLVK